MMSAMRLALASLSLMTAAFGQAPATSSWGDSRGGGFRRNRGLRIDLILAAPALAATAAACRVDPEPRGWDKPSDHAPVLAEFKR